MQWGWYKDTNTCKLFLHMILKANWKDGAYQGVEVPRGAFVSSYPELGSLTVYLLLLHKCNSILSLILAGFPAFFFVKFLKYFCSYF